MMKRTIAVLFAALLLSLPVGAANTRVPSQGGGGVSVTTTNDFTGANSFLDNDNFTLKNTSDPTKTAIFNLAAITTGTKRTYALPNVSSTLAVLAANAFTGNQYLSASTYLGFNLSGYPAFYYSAAQTPDSTLFLTSALSGSLIIAEGGDEGFDFAHADSANPTLFGHSATQSTTQWWSLTHDTTDAVLGTGAGALKVSSASGMILSTGTAPTVSACGTTPSTVSGSATAGRLTTGSGGTVQSCTLTFVPALAAAPACVANDETAILLIRAVATTTTLVIDSAVAGTLASQVLTYHCFGGV